MEKLCVQAGQAKRAFPTKDIQIRFSSAKPTHPQLSFKKQYCSEMSDNLIG